CPIDTQTLDTFPWRAQRTRRFCRASTFRWAEKSRQPLNLPAKAGSHSKKGSTRLKPEATAKKVQNCSNRKPQQKRVYFDRRDGSTSTQEDRSCSRSDSTSSRLARA